MSTPMLNQWERAEIERSAVEASHVDLANLVADETQIKRYLDPPAETSHPLEYSFYLLGNVKGKTILEYGCGDGLNTIPLARRGAHVKALDISPELVNVGRHRLAANHVSGDVEFIVGSAHDLPLPDDSVDIVFGMAILHHLDLALSAQEVRRVLRKGGRAIFQEPVRNSIVIKALRGLIPYRAPDTSPFERPLTDQELDNYAKTFTSYRTKAFILPTTSLINVLPPLRRAFLSSCYRLDAAILRTFPGLGYYASVRVIELVK